MATLTVDAFKSRAVYTLAGVTAVEQESGTITVTVHAEGDTIMDVVVASNAAPPVTVHLDRTQAVELILALSSMIADM